MLGLIAAVGSFIGSSIVIRINEKSLNLIIAAILLILSITLFNKDKIGIKEKKFNHKNIIIVSFFTFLLGIYGGFFGGGFGTFIMFLLVMLGLTFIKSAAIGRIVGFIMSASASIVFALNGLINYTYALSLGLGCALGSWIGVGIALKKGDKFIKTLFIIIIFLTIAKLVLNFFNINII